MFDSAADHEAVELILRPFNAFLDDTKAGQVGSDLSQGGDIPSLRQEPYAQVSTRGRRLDGGRTRPFQRMPNRIQPGRGQGHAQSQAAGTVERGLQRELPRPSLHASDLEDGVLA